MIFGCNEEDLEWKLAVVLDYSQIPTLCLIWSPPFSNAEPGKLR